jgi:F-type H+-transporting ATPase subunit a
MFALEFPPINEVIRWRDLFPTFNKIALIAVAATLITAILLFIASRRDPLVAPKGVRNVVEAIIDFIEGIVMQTIGRDGLGWTWFLLSLFMFIYLCNLPGIIPIFLYMPATARLAIPLFLALVVWVIYNGVGIKHQGLGGYLKSIGFPPGVPKPIYVLLTPIEFISTLIVRPFSLMIRLFANMLAGHLLLVTFALLTDAMIHAQTKQFLLIPLSILPFGMQIFLTAFEVLVGFLQAYIFTILAAVYIGTALHPEH